MSTPPKQMLFDSAPKCFYSERSPIWRSSIPWQLIRRAAVTLRRIDNNLLKKAEQAVRKSDEEQLHKPSFSPDLHGCGP